MASAAAPAANHRQSLNSESSASSLLLALRDARSHQRHQVLACRGLCSGIQKASMLGPGEFLELMKDRSPRDVRVEVRTGNYFKQPMSGICEGYMQANLMAVPKDVAGDLEEYCRLNFGPMALIFNSKPGQFDIPPFSTDSDVRTDLTAYNVYVNGEHTETVSDLTKFAEQVQDFCFFYLGCSFSFDGALLKGGVPLRNLEQKLTNVPMFRTNVECHQCGVFHGNEVVSMRPIPKELVERSVQITHPMTDVHGAPMHIGDPSVIGVDAEKLDYGVKVTFHEGDIPVFWPCGVTARDTVEATKLPLAFTHRPGSMMVTDTPMEENKATPSQEDLPRVVWLDDAPPLASVVSQAAMDHIKSLEAAAMEDFDGDLLVPDDILKSALSLSHAKSVAITTSFPAKTDGIPGAIAMATTLQVLGKKVVLVANNKKQDMEKLVAKLLEKGLLTAPIPVECYTGSREDARSFLTSQDGGQPRFDHLVAVGQARRRQDDGGQQLHLNGAEVGGMNSLFDVAKETPHVFTTGIASGEGVSAIGKTGERVIPVTKYLICAGVSSWGSYALSVALALLRLCPIHDRYRRRALGLPPTQEEAAKVLASAPTLDKEQQIVAVMLEIGLQEAAGDGKMAGDRHTKKIQQLTDVLH